MGIVARLLYDRRVEPGRTGVFKIDYAKDATVLHTNKEQLLRTHPGLQENNRLLEGYFPLTPLKKDTQYHAFILLDPK